jgi:hypothetical protein
MATPRSPHRLAVARFALLTATCAAALALASVARADDRADSDVPPSRMQQPLAVRLGTTQLLVPQRQWADAFATLTVARQPMARLGLEGTVGAGGTPHHLGPYLGLAARAMLLSNQRGAFTVALGADTAFLDRLGMAAFGRVEAAFELRKRDGFTLLAGGGVATPLSDSPWRSRACGGIEGDPCHRYKFGDVAFFGTFQAGMNF